MERTIFGAMCIVMGLIVLTFFYWEAGKNRAADAQSNMAIEKG